MRSAFLQTGLAATAAARLRRTVAWSQTDPLLAIGLVGVAVLAAVALLADVIAPKDPYAIDAASRLKGPSSTFLLGTDRYGRDILSRLIFGTRVSLGTAFIAVSTACLVGTLFGLLAGYFRGWLDQVLMRLMDVLFSFPPLLFALTLAAAVGPSTINSSVAIAVIYVPVFARVTRGSVLAEGVREYVDASRVIGASNARTLLVHILPNILTPLVVQFSLALAAAILLESGLSYLGLGTQPPAASWGTLLNEGQPFLTQAPWMSIFPGIVIASSVFLFFLVGDGLRDRLDPRIRR